MPLSFYHSLSKLKITRRNYAMKFFFVAFLGIHIPLIGLLCYLLVRFSEKNQLIPVLITVLLCTLVSTACTIYVINRLLLPLKMIRFAFKNYLNQNVLPELPEIYTDDVGEIMKDVNRVINHLDSMVDDKNDIIAILSHDMRAPIIRISGIAQILEVDNETPKEEYTQIILQECDSSLLMLEHILQMMKDENGSLWLLRLKPINLKLLLINIVNKLNKQAATKNVSININVDDELLITAEKTLFGQAIINLLENAIKFSNNDSAIHITSELENDLIHLKITDQGIGFEPEAKEGLFNRFTKFGQTGTNGEKSTGLGLYLCRRIINNHNGKLTAFSEGKDKGATFTVTLPLYVDSENAKLVPTV